MHSPALWAAVVVASVGSCDPAQLVHPLTDPATAKVDPRLAGTWFARDHENEFMLFIESRDAQHVDLLLVGRSTHDGVNSVAWEGFASSVGGKSYLNLRERLVSDGLANTFTLKPTYLLARYELKGEQLTLSYLSNEALEGDGGVKLDADGPVLAAAVQRLPAAAFSQFQTFKRFKVPAR